MRFNDSTRAAVREALTGADTVTKAEAEVTGRWVKAAEALAADGIASLAAFSEAKEAIRAELVIPGLSMSEVSDAPSVWRRGAELPKAGSEAEAMEVALERAKAKAKAKAEGKDEAEAEAEAVAAFKAERAALREAYQKVRTTANVMVSRLKEYLPMAAIRAAVRAKAKAEGVDEAEALKAHEAEAEAEAKAKAEAEAKAEAAKVAGMTVAERAEAGKADAVHKATEAIAKVLTRLQKAGAGAAAYEHLEAALAALIIKPSIVEGTATGPSHGADALTPMGRPAGIAA